MKKRISAVITLIFFVLAAMAQVIPNGVYVIKYTESPSYVLTMKDDKSSDGNQVVACEWQNKTSQMWKVENLVGGTIVLRSVANNKLVINSKNNQLANAALIVTSSYKGINRQKWVPERHSNGSYVLMMSENKNFSLELKDGTGNAKNNGTVELWSTHKCNHQQWTFEEIDSSSTPDPNSTSTTTSSTSSTSPSSSSQYEGNVYYIKSAGDPNFVLTVKGKASNHQWVVIQKNKKSDAQKWRLTHEKDDSYALRSLLDENFVISINDQLRGFLWLSEFQGSDLERWKAVRMDNGNYVLLLTKDRNRAIDVEGAAYEENRGVQLYGRNNAPNQQWIMERVDGDNNSGTTTTTTKPSDSNSGSTNTTTKPSDSNSGSTNTTTKPADNNSGSTSTSSTSQKEGNVYYIKSAGDPNFVISIDGKPTNQKRLVIQKNRKADAQKWRLTHEKDDTYALRSILDENLVISINDQMRGFLWLSEFKGSDLERWKAVKMQNGNYMLLLSKDQNRAIDIEAAKYEENRGLQIYGRHNDLNQQWIMERVDGTSSSTSTTTTTTKPSNNNSGTTNTTTKPSNNNSGSTNTTTKPSNSNSGTTNTTTKPSNSNSGSTSSTSSTQHEGNIYIIKTSGDPNYVITVDGKPSNHKRLVIQKNRKADAQKWRLTREKDGSYILRSLLDENFVISINDQLRGFLWLSEYKGSDLERWKAVKMDNGNYVLLLTKDQERAIDVEAAAYEENRGIQLYGRHDGPNQQWIMERVGGTSSTTSTTTTTTKPSNDNSGTTNTSSSSQHEGNIYIIKTSGDPTFVLTVKGKASNHQWVVIQKNQKTNAQKWRLTREKDGSYILRSLLDENFVISINDQLRGFLWLSEYKGSDLERWKAVKMDNGNYVLLLTKDQERAIDVEGATYEENRGAQLYGRHDGPNQQWILELVNK
jgi:hypothetical protein